jgi:hypothetical protein
MGMSTTAVLPTIDPELLGTPLDLARPELEEIMERYIAKEVPALLRRPTALVVADAGGTNQRLKTAFEREGWTVTSCPGPGSGNCPLLRGDACLLRESADAAVVFVDPRGPSAHVRELARIRCAVDPSSPGVVALTGAFDAPTRCGTNAVIGANRGSEAIVGTAIEVLEPTD